MRVSGSLMAMAAAMALSAVFLSSPSARAQAPAVPAKVITIKAPCLAGGGMVLRPDLRGTSGRRGRVVIRVVHRPGCALAGRTTFRSESTWASGDPKQTTVAARVAQHTMNCAREMPMLLIMDSSIEVVEFV